MKRTSVACMRALVLGFFMLATCWWPALPAQEETDKEEVDAAEAFLGSLGWIAGPATESIGTMAQIDIPPAFRLLKQDGTIKLLQAFGNLTSGSELAILAPEGNLDWFVCFEFEPCGYVKDDDDIDADGLLEGLKAGNKESNTRRREQGLPEMTLLGWAVPPRYDPQTRNLEWGLRLSAEGGELINFDTRLLGREGVMHVSLVVDTEDMQTILPTFKRLLERFSYKEGRRYAEYRKGDKVSQYTLGALIGGGALAVAAKTGFLAKFWKFLILIPVAIAAFFKRMFGGRRAPPPPRMARRGPAQAFGKAPNDGPNDGV